MVRGAHLPQRTRSHTNATNTANTTPPLPWSLGPSVPPPHLFPMSRHPGLLPLCVEEFLLPMGPLPYLWSAGGQSASPRGDLPHMSAHRTPCQKSALALFLRQGWGRTSGEGKRLACVGGAGEEAPGCTKGWGRAALTVTAFSMSYSLPSSWRPNLL